MSETEYPIARVRVPREDMVWSYLGEQAHYTFQCPIYLGARKCGHISYGLNDAMTHVVFKFYDKKNLRFLRWLVARYGSYAD